MCYFSGLAPGRIAGGGYDVPRRDRVAGTRTSGLYRNVSRVSHFYSNTEYRVLPAAAATHLRHPHVLPRADQHLQADTVQETRVSIKWYKICSNVYLS